MISGQGKGIRDDLAQDLFDWAWIINMIMEGQEKNRVIMHEILAGLDFNSRPKEFIRQIMQHLEMEESKQLNRVVLFDRIIHIYDALKGEYQEHMNKPKFNAIPVEVKNFLWTVFKQYHECQCEMARFGQSKPGLRPNDNQNLSMNMVNMFLDVPNLQSTEEIEFFQRKMFDIYKNFVPQVVNSMRLNPPPPSNPYRPTFAGFPKQPDFFGAARDFPPRYFPDNMMSHGSFPMPRKDFMPDMRMGSQFGSFDRVGSADSMRGGMKNNPFSHMPLDDYEQKLYSHRNIRSGMEMDLRDSHIAPEFSSQKQLSRKIRERPYGGTDFYGFGEPRKRQKREDEVSIFDQENKGKITSVKCCCDKEPNCVYCELRIQDPLNDVEQVIQMERITDFEANPFVCELSKKNIEKLLKNRDKFDIEIRCLRVSGSNKNTLGWPNHTRLLIQGQTVMEFNPQATFSMKIRKDKPILLSKQTVITGDSNFPIQIKLVSNIQPDVNKREFLEQYVVGVVQVVKLSAETLYHKIMANIQPKNVFEFFHLEGSDGKDSEGDLEKVRMTLADPFSKSIIKDPVRSINCTHPQCFDLKVFLMMAATNHSWKCPICSKDARKFVLDEEAKELMKNCQKMIKQPKAIFFYSEGGHEFQYEEEEISEPKAIQKLEPNLAGGRTSRNSQEIEMGDHKREQEQEEEEQEEQRILKQSEDQS